MTESKIIHLDTSFLDKVADLYARVYAGPPWFEIKKCASCNETYGKTDDLKLFKEGVACRRCKKPLDLIDYWYGGPAHQVFKDATARPGFVGVGVTHKSGDLIAFSWGFQVPRQDTPTVLFSKVEQLLVDHEVDPSETFYAAETGVDPSYQSHGLGTRIMYARFKAAKDAGFKGTCGRTINPNLVGRYQHLFGEKNVFSLFNDPDPVKSDRIWYYSPLDKLKYLPETTNGL